MNGIINKNFFQKGIKLSLTLIIASVLFCSCTTAQQKPHTSKDTSLSEERISDRTTTVSSSEQGNRHIDSIQTNPSKPEAIHTESINKSLNPTYSPPEPPEFIPVAERFSPLNEPVSISVSGASLREVIHSIAETVGLNVVMEKGVRPDTPVTVTLKHVTAADALNIILSSTDYFYEIKDNILYIKAMKTRMFDFGHPSIVQSYGVDIGGDILGASSQETIGKIRGSIVLSKKSDQKSFNFWDALEEGIKSILEMEATSQLPELKPSYTLNRLTGTIVVTAGRSALKRVQEYLERVKSVLSRQVMIEARVVEVKLSEGSKYGIDWSFLDDWKGVGNITIGTQEFNPSRQTGTPVFQLGITGVNFTSLLEALQSQGEVKILSNPRVNLMNGQTALLSVGRSIDIISRVESTTSTGTDTSGQTTFSVETSNILSGIIIGMVPYINDKNEVSLTITPIVSDLVTLEERQVGQVGQNNIIVSLPTIDLKEMSTTVKVKDGDMIVLGGLITTKESVTEDEVPFLARIPLIGYLFRRHDETKERQELIIMLKPTVIND